MADAVNFYIESDKNTTIGGERYVFQIATKKVLVEKTEGSSGQTDYNSLRGDRFFMSAHT